MSAKYYRNYRLLNREKLNQYRRDYYNKNKKAHKKWYLENEERAAAYWKSYKEKHRDRYAEMDSINHFKRKYPSELAETAILLNLLNRKTREKMNGKIQNNNQ